MRENEGKDNANQSSDKLFRIIECLAANRLPNRLSELSEKLDMPQPTVLRYLKTLCAHGYAYHDDNSGCYALTWKICRLADAVKANLALRSMASPFLDALANELNTGACLVVEHDSGAIYLDFVDNPHTIMKTLLRIGKSAPMHTTASGKVLLSSYSERRVNEIIEKNGLTRLTHRTITEKPALYAELERVREQGYAVDDEECEEGHVCISVPLFDYTGRVAAAISVFDVTDHMSEARVQREVLPRLKKVAEEISFRMGYVRDL